MAYPGSVQVIDSEESYASPAPMGMGGYGAQALIVNSPVGAWTYMVNPAVWQCWATGGHLVPALAKAWWEPGRNGNGPNMSGRGEGYITSMAAEGWLQVPHNLPGLVAFGEARRIGPLTPSNVLNVYTVQRNVLAAPEKHHTSAWHRPQQFGSLVHWDHDADGERIARQHIAKIVMGMDAENLPAAIARAAVRPVLKAIETQLARVANPIRDREIRRLYAQLPRSARTLVDVGTIAVIRDDGEE